MIRIVCRYIRVVISDEAKHTIETSVKQAGNKFEVGGALLGYRIGHIFYVLVATTPRKNANKSLTTFTLDSEDHSEQARELAGSFRFAPYLVGIWHDHICDGHCFSEQDRKSNSYMAEYLGGALSLLVARYSIDIPYVMRTYYISPTGEEEECHTHYACNRFHFVKNFWRNINTKE